MDIQDQLLQESVLQQRRQRIQDATERFQKGHLPPSQRQSWLCLIVFGVEDKL